MNNQGMKIRAARIADAPAICDLVNYWAERGRMLHRSLESVYQSLRDFLVAEDGDGAVAGCVAMGIYWANLAEVKSLAVAHAARGKGVGGALTKAIIAQARKLGVGKLFALTYEKDFFSRYGFEVIDRSLLPEKVWQACIYCPKAECCDEVAMMLSLQKRRAAPAVAVRALARRRRGTKRAR